MKWRQKSDRDGDPVPDCWITDAGHIVARCRIGDVAVFVVTKACSRVPTDYCRSRDEVIEVLRGYEHDDSV